MKVAVNDFIFKDLHTVYQAIVDKNKLQCYFVSHASNSLDQADQLNWEWKDYNASCVVSDIKTIANESISFKWGASGYEKQVVIRLSKEENEKTKIQIEEGEFEMTEESVQKMLGQTQGWTDFICSLKAYLYTGINLRNGQYN